MQSQIKQEIKEEIKKQMKEEIKEEMKKDIEKEIKEELSKEDLRRIECDKMEKDLELYKSENAKIRNLNVKGEEISLELEATKKNVISLEEDNNMKRKISSFLFLLVSLLYLYKISLTDSSNLTKYRGYVGISLLMFASVMVLDIMNSSSNDINTKKNYGKISSIINMVGMYLACVVIIYTNFKDFKNIPKDFMSFATKSGNKLSKYSTIIIIGFIIIATMFSYFKTFFTSIFKK